MTLSWFGDFFRTLPDVARAVYQFGDPNGVGSGWWGFVILGIWGVFLIAIPLGLAYRLREEHGWISATFGVIGGLAILWWALGIIPSAIIYFIDSNKELLSGPIIPASAGFSIGTYRVDVASNLYDVIRDITVVTVNMVVTGLTIYAALRVQRRFPKTIDPDEHRAAMYRE